MPISGTQLISDLSSSAKEVCCLALQALLKRHRSYWSRRHVHQLITLSQENEIILCKVFPTSLEGGTLTWFQQLKLDSVTSFEYTSEEFMKNYAIWIQKCKHLDNLFEVPKCENGPLKSYMDRFEVVMLLVSDFIQYIATLKYPFTIRVYCNKMHQEVSRHQIISLATSSW